MSSPRPRVFISYSHKDEAWKDRVATHLGALAQEGRLEFWEDRHIAGGDEWLPAIEAAIQTSRAALLLISADFLDSKFILNEEVPRLVERRIKEGVRVIPVIVRPCAWTQVGWLKRIQARVKDGKPLTSMSETEPRAVGVCSGHRARRERPPAATSPGGR